MVPFGASALLGCSEVIVGCRQHQVLSTVWSALASFVARPGPEPFLARPARNFGLALHVLWCRPARSAPGFRRARPAPGVRPGLPASGFRLARPAPAFRLAPRAGVWFGPAGARISFGSAGAGVLCRAAEAGSFCGAGVETARHTSLHFAPCSSVKPAALRSQWPRQQARPWLTGRPVALSTGRCGRAARFFRCKPNMGNRVVPGGPIAGRGDATV